jgi:hypothetical protein
MIWRVLGGGTPHANDSSVGDAAERIRVQFIRESVAQVCRQAFTSRDEARVAAGELRRYFGWVRSRLPLPVQEPLLTEIESLCSFLGAPPDLETHPAP